MRRRGLLEYELEQMAARASAATAGPWYCRGAWLENRLNEARYLFERSEDARFIAAARSDMPRLLTEIRRLRQALEQIEWRCAFIANRSDSTRQELLREISASRGLTPGEAEQVALALIEENLRRRAARCAEEEA